MIEERWRCGGCHAIQLRRNAPARAKTILSREPRAAERPQICFRFATAGVDVQGRGAFKEWIKNFQAKIADGRLTNREIFPSADGKRVVSRWLATGKNRGLFGTAADGRPIEFTGIAIWLHRLRLAGQVRQQRSAANATESSPTESPERALDPRESLPMG